VQFHRHSNFSLPVGLHAAHRERFWIEGVGDRNRKRVSVTTAMANNNESDEGGEKKWKGN